jgi:hypothetical protein
MDETQQQHFIGLEFWQVKKFAYTGLDGVNRGRHRSIIKARHIRCSALALRSGAIGGIPDIDFNFFGGIAALRDSDLDLTKRHTSHISHCNKTQPDNYKQKKDDTHDPSYYRSN